MIKHNLKYIISYILFIILFVLGAVFYRQPFFAVLVLLLCILPVISIYITVKCLPKIDITARLIQISVTEKNSFTLIISVNNPTFFSFLNIILHFAYENMFYPQSMDSTLSLSAPMKRKNNVSFNFETSVPGMCNFTLSNATMTDPLHFATFPLKCDISLNAPVYPEKVDTTFPLYPAAFADTDDSEHASDGKSMSMDIKEIREYRPGDKLKNIHWKATAKKDELLVRDFEGSAERIIMLLPNMCREKLPATIRTMYSYMKFLHSKNEVFRLCLFDGTAFFEVPVNNPDDIDNALLKSYYMPVFNTDGAMLDTYKHFNPTSEILLINGTNIEQH